MRIVVLSSSLYSETACATASHLAGLGCIPPGALSLGTLDLTMLRRKLAQWGPHQFTSYARMKLWPQNRSEAPTIHNPHLERYLRRDGRIFRNLKEVGRFYGFPVATCADQNSSTSLAQLRRWSPDLIIFAGGNILRKPLLQLPRRGVINMHLGLLPQIRGMNSPEWSLLTRVPPGITIHYIDAGIDTGAILKKYEYPDAMRCQTLTELRQRLIAFAIEKLGDVVAELEREALLPTPQIDNNPGRSPDRQFFVMHDWLRGRAEECLAKNRTVTTGRTLNE
jgi:hypothetical protein